MPYYDKLIRDRVPEHMLARGVAHRVRTLSDAEYSARLRAKLLEEGEEFEGASRADDRLGELADLLEVIYALATLDAETPEGLEVRRAAKAEQNGTFRQRFLLIEAEEPAPYDSDDSN